MLLILFKTKSMINTKGWLLIILLLVGSAVNAQIFDPVKWTTKVEKLSDTEYELIAEATIDPSWHLYSQHVPEDGPIATTFTFAGNGSYLRKGNTKEDNGITVDDKVFDMRIKYFENKASFKQRIRLKSNDPFKVNATVEFMVCNDKKCLPPKEVDLVFAIN